VASEEEDDDELRVEHHPSPHFTSAVASGVHITGPSPDKYFHILFYSDAPLLKYETARRTEGSRYEVTVERGGQSAYREDKARIALRIETVRDLHGLLGEVLRDNPIEEQLGGAPLEDGIDRDAI
jgi:hypothetical protein